MYGSRSSASMYRSTAIDTAQQLSQQRQLVLLLDGLVERVRLAERHIGEGDTAAKVKAIGSALRILEALRGSLDFEAGGSISTQLAEIYDTASLWLADANARNDTARLAQVLELLVPIAQAYSALPDQSAATPG